MQIPLQLQYKAGESLQSQLFRQLRNLILDGRLKPGSSLVARLICCLMMSNSERSNSVFESLPSVFPRCAVKPSPYHDDFFS